MASKGDKDLRDKVSQAGITASDIARMTAGAVTIQQAARWLRALRPLSVALLLSRLCDELPDFLAASPRPKRGRPYVKQQQQGDQEPVKAAVQPLETTTENTRPAISTPTTQPTKQPTAPPRPRPVAAKPPARTTAPPTKPATPKQQPTIRAQQVPARGYGDATVRESGDFWYFEYAGSGWKVPRSYPRKATYLFNGTPVDTSAFALIP